MFSGCRILNHRKERNQKMEKRIYNLHIKASYGAGRQKACSGKAPYDSDSQAAMAAKESNGMAYPCAWCSKWHVGRPLSMKELERWENIRLPGKFNEMLLRG
jgi:hypothetical protein